MNELLEMLSYRRPYGSSTLKQFIRCHIAPIGALPDAHGNWILDIGTDPAMLWSSHTDSVHNGDGRQRIAVSQGRIMTAPNKRGKRSNCLGADDAVGCWMMLAMVRAGVPGRYIFHAGEEVGGKGSQALADDVDMLTGIQAAIAFDRRGTNSVITHQFGRCASEAFAQSMVTALTRAGLAGYRPDSTGIFTDTANYTHLVPECSNLSVGYFGEHRTDEYIDIAHVLKMRDALCVLDCHDLVIEREPEEDRFTWHDWHDDLIIGSSTLLPVDSRRHWAREDMDLTYHAISRDWSLTGLMLCGHHLDEPAAYWSHDSKWTPQEFCDDCMMLDEALYDDLHAYGNHLGGVSA